MKILKIGFSKPTKVKISQEIAEPELSILNQSKGIIDNFLASKKNLGKIYITDGDMYGNKDCISVIHSKQNSNSRISILKNGNLPLLRKIYAAVEEVTKTI